VWRGPGGRGWGVGAVAVVRDMDWRGVEEFTSRTTERIAGYGTINLKITQINKVIRPL
jgi:hypothetical protein